MVAGLVALLASAAPSSTVAEREAAVTSTVVPVTPAGDIGGGRIDAVAALRALGAKVTPPGGGSASGVLAVTAPSKALTYIRMSSFDVAWTETLPAGVTVAARTVTQQSTRVEGAVCDPTAWESGDPVPGEGSPFTAADLSDGTCYRWVVDLVDSAGTASSVTTRLVMVDRAKPAIVPVLPKRLTRTSAPKIAFRWRLDDGDTGSGVSADVRILTQQGRVRGASCTGWRTWGRTSVPADETEDDYTVSGPICVRLRLTATDMAGNTTTTFLPAYLHR
jgi:hypothetical protein